MRRRFRRKLGYRFEDYYFKPRGVPMNTLEESSLSHDELETLRLRYIEKMNQADAAGKMGISQSQYQRDIVQAMTKLVEAVINGKAIRIEKKSEGLRT